MNITDKILRRVTIEDVNAPVSADTKKYVPKVGDKVIHNGSQQRGRVVAVETIGGTLTLAVEFLNGRKCSGLSRLEFTLANNEVFAPVSKVDVVERFNTTLPAPEMPKLEGTISTESILEELS